MTAEVEIDGFRVASAAFIEVGLLGHSLDKVDSILFWDN